MRNGSIELNQVLSTVVDLAVYETGEEWLSELDSLGIVHEEAPD